MRHILRYGLPSLAAGAIALAAACNSVSISSTPECRLGETRACPGGIQRCSPCMTGDDPYCADPVNNYGAPTWTACRPPPPYVPPIDPRWTCGPSFWGDGNECDCGCGAPDPDCMGTTASFCSTCFLSGSCACPTNDFCPGDSCPSPLLDPVDNSTCKKAAPEDSDTACGNGVDDDLDGFIDCADSDCQGHLACPPATWHCDPSLYGDGSRCDCGCGIHDPDCKDALLTSCTVCDELGGCNAAMCPGTIAPTDNATCTP